MPVARPRRARSRRRWSGSGRASCGGSRTRASPSTRSSRAWSSSRREGSSGCTGRRSRRSSARSRGRLGLGPAHRRRHAPLHRPRRGERRAAGQILIVAAKEEESFLEPLPLSLLPLPPDRYAELEGLGLRRLGELAQLPGGAVAERLGVEGRKAWRLARGGRRAKVRGRKPASSSPRRSSSRRRSANELTLRRALGSLLERLLARPERAGRPFRKLALAARLVDGGSWRRAVTLRDATAERPACASALGPKLAELPAPIVELRLEAVELAEHTGQQLALVEPAGEEAAAAARGAAAGAREHGDGLGVRRGGGGAVVADPGERERSSSRGRVAGRLNAPRPALVEQGRRSARGREPQLVDARARGVARRRPLVDGGAGRPPLLRGRPRERPERLRLPRPRGELLVHARTPRGA